MEAGPSAMTTTHTSARPDAPAAPAEPPVDVLVIGAGFSGLGMLYHLLERGFSARVVEAGDDVGGTWYWNRYPGCRCDSPTEVYQFFFSKELLQDWDWTHVYPAQPEILSYLRHVADRFDLRRHISLETRVRSASFNDATGTWRSTLDTGEVVESRFLVTAVGCLSDPQVPAYPGLENFRGEWHHTSRWPHSGVDFTGKRVGVIGTGSSGIQVIPEIAKEAAHLTVFQRTANFSFPARNRPLRPGEMEEFKASYDAIHAEIRAAKLGQRFAPMPGSALAVPAEVRQRFYEESWARGNAVLLFSGWEDLLTNEEANATAADFVRSKIAERIDDPETRDSLLPRNHPLGTKRPPLDTEYFETFNRDNVTLVDLRRTPIEEFCDGGVRVQTGVPDESQVHELDVLVFATGFDAITGPLLEIDITGSGGMSLREKWQDGPLTYLGLATAGFPNMFTITGPGSPAVISNMPTAIEQHNEWIRDCLVYMRDHGYQRIETSATTEEEWTVHVSELAQETLLVKVDSWYMGSNIPGKPRRFLSYLGGVGTYGDVITGVAAKDYDGFTFG